ncbi:methyl-accepting chemotaxis protein, partial [Actinoplanes sp. NPDC051851]|uniref:methyl-accepting chemotaxis protein n=1 Tax=Actinoplanes sp. NPDC051851 TaxID=3154753 RepID=UPI003413A3B4
MTIKLRLIICVVLITGLSLVLVVTFIARRSLAEARDTGFSYAQETAERYGAQVQQQLMMGMGTSRDMSQAMLAESTSGGNRATANAELKAVLSGHSGYLAVWTAWEPNAFDGKDRRYRNADARSDATGRFVPYWYRDGDTITSSALTDYTEEGAGDYYLIAQQSGKEKVLEPYEYEVGGETVLMTSLVAPIVKSGSTVGVAGIDLPLDTLGTLFASLKPLDTGSAMLVSAGGLLVAGGDSAGAGKAADAAVVALASTATAQGSAARRVISGDDEQVQIAAPLSLGDTDTWSIIVTVPTSTILATAHQSLTISIWITVAALLVAAGVALLVGRSMVRPIDRLRRRMAEIADGDGDLTQRATVRTEDEAGQLAGAFNRFVEKVAGTVRGIAGSATEVQAAADRLAESTDRLNGDAAQVSDKSGTAAEATQTVNYSVQSVAAGAEEMNAAIGEIASSAAQAAQVA